MAKRKPHEAIDWPPIQREYSLGQYTLRQLAATYGVDAAVIVRKAKREGWPRDKRQEVKALSEAQLLTVGLDPAGINTSTPTAQDVAAAATVRTNVILAHRRDALRFRALVMTMMAELETMTEAPMLIKDLQACLAQCQAGEEIPHAILARADTLLGQALTLDNRSGILKSLSETLTKVVQIEREAFGINDPDTTPPPDPEANADEFRTKAFIARVMSMAGPTTIIESNP